MPVHDIRPLGPEEASSRNGGIILAISGDFSNRREDLERLLGRVVSRIRDMAREAGGEPSGRLTDDDHLPPDGRNPGGVEPDSDISGMLRDMGIPVGEASVEEAPDGGVPAAGDPGVPEDDAGPGPLRIPLGALDKVDVWNRILLPMDAIPGLGHQDPAWFQELGQYLAEDPELEREHILLSCVPEGAGITHIAVFHSGAMVLGGGMPDRSRGGDLMSLAANDILPRQTVEMVVRNADPSDGAFVNPWVEEDVPTVGMVVRARGDRGSLDAFRRRITQVLDGSGGRPVREVTNGDEAMLFVTFAGFREVLEAFRSVLSGGGPLVGCCLENPDLRVFVGCAAKNLGGFNCMVARMDERGLMLIPKISVSGEDGGADPRDRFGQWFEQMEQILPEPESANRVPGAVFLPLDAVVRLLHEPAGGAPMNDALPPAPGLH